MLQWRVEIACEKWHKLLSIDTGGPCQGIFVYGPQMVHGKWVEGFWRYTIHKWGIANIEASVLSTSPGLLFRRAYLMCIVHILTVQSRSECRVCVSNTYILPPRGGLAPKILSEQEPILVI